MKNLKNYLIIFIILTSFCYSVNANNNLNLNKISYNTFQSMEYIDISVEDAWNLLNDTSNGIQIPIDVRTDDEWKTDHINTPEPENPKHHNFNEWYNEDILIDFMTLYDGKEIIIYCRSGGRSVAAINILIDNSFNGILYNMLGGISAWKVAGYPTIPNQPPSNPNISGIINGKIGENYEFQFFSNDPDNDILYYYINWSDTYIEEWIGPYDSGKVVNISHNWTDRGTYIIQTKVRDKYGDESNWSTFEVKISRVKNVNQIPRLLLLFKHYYLLKH